VMGAVWVFEVLCESKITLFIILSGEPEGSGSVSNTSRAAPPTIWDCNAVTRSASTTRPPRETFTSKTPSLTKASDWEQIIFLLDSLREQVNMMKSTLPIPAGHVTNLCG